MSSIPHRKRVQQRPFFQKLPYVTRHSFLVTLFVVAVNYACNQDSKSVKLDWKDKFNETLCRLPDDVALCIGLHVCAKSIDDLVWPSVRKLCPLRNCALFRATVRWALCKFFLDVCV